MIPVSLGASLARCFSRLTPEPGAAGRTKKHQEQTGPTVWSRCFFDASILLQCRLNVFSTAFSMIQMLLRFDASAGELQPSISVSLQLSCSSSCFQLMSLPTAFCLCSSLLKYAGNLVHFHSLKKAHLIQEIYGKLTFYNFSSFLAMVIGRIQKKTDKYVYALNHTQAQKVCIRFLRGQ